MSSLKFIALLFSAVLVISTQAACPSGPPSTNTTSGGFIYEYPYRKFSWP